MEDRTLLTLEHNGFSGGGGMLVRLILGGGWDSLLGKKLEKFLASS